MAEEKEIESSLNTTTSSNQGFAAASALQIRLECSQIIENVEMFLRGSKLSITQNPETGEIKTQSISIGTSKTNDIGVQSILNRLQLVLNPQVVQGNFQTDRQGHSYEYDYYVSQLREELAEDIITNCYKWDIDNSDLNGIIDSIMNIIEPFMTRLIDNKERESYEKTLIHAEKNLIEADKKMRLLG